MSFLSMQMRDYDFRSLPNPTEDLGEKLLQAAKEREKEKKKTPDDLLREKVQQEAEQAKRFPLGVLGSGGIAVQKS